MPTTYIVPSRTTNTPHTWRVKPWDFVYQTWDESLVAWDSLTFTWDTWGTGFPATVYTSRIIP